MGRRVNTGVGDNPDEYYFECDDCEGSGKVMAIAGIDEEADEPILEEGECPNCDGLGFVEGDEFDLEDDY